MPSTKTKTKQKPLTKSADLAQLRMFVEMIARLQDETETKDGWENDDAWETLMRLIDDARDLVGDPEHKKVDGW